MLIGTTICSSDSCSGYLQLETLLKFFPVPAYRNLTIQCLTEVAALNFGDFYNVQYVKMYTIFIGQLRVN